MCRLTIHDRDDNILSVRVTAVLVADLPRGPTDIATLALRFPGYPSRVDAVLDAAESALKGVGQDGGDLLCARIQLLHGQKDLWERQECQVRKGDHERQGY